MGFVDIDGIRAGPRIDRVTDIPNEIFESQVDIPESIQDMDARAITEEDIDDTDLDWDQFQTVVEYFNLCSGHEVVEASSWYYEIKFEYHGDNSEEIVFTDISHKEQLPGKRVS